MKLLGLPLARLAALLLAGLAAGAAAGVLTSGGGGGGHKRRAVSPPAGGGWPFHRRVPGFTLTTAGESRLSLAGLRGRVVVLAPSLTLCHEVCPLTTQALMQLQHRLAAKGLAGDVRVVEATVDPWRDSPARLRAYERLTGAQLLQLTGSVGRMRRFWDFFGIGFRRVAQGRPPDTDWWTGRAERFDVEHENGLFFVDRAGYERLYLPGMPRLGGEPLEGALRRLLRASRGRLAADAGEGWSVAEAMSAVERLLRTA